MISSRSLKQRIALQFLVIIAPMATVLVYQTISDSRQTAELHEVSIRQSSAAGAREQYKVFVDGVLDAVESGRVSVPAITALAGVQGHLNVLAGVDHTRDIPPLINLTNELLSVLRQDREFKTLAPHRVTDAKGAVSGQFIAEMRTPGGISRGAAALGGTLDKPAYTRAR